MTAPVVTAGAAVASTSVSIDLDQVQGNVIGFQKDFQCFLFVRFPDKPHAQAWLKTVVGEIATAQEVLEFNTLFKRIRSRRSDREGGVKATWMNIGFTHRGLIELAAPNVDQFHDDFKRGMRDQQTAQANGDVDDSDPAKWVFPADKGDIHAVLLLASDDESDLNAEVSRQVTAIADSGLLLVFKQDGKARPDDPGHEHFGFDDGVSQPGLRDDRVTDPDPKKRQAGQDRICPGDFIIGYPTQPNSAPPTGSHEAPCGPVSTGWPASTGPDRPYPAGQQPPTVPTPAWTKNGTYLVFRRLRQDVAGFRAFVHDTAVSEQRSEDLIGAKLVGRYRSGAPAETLSNLIAGVDTTNQEHDPGPVHAELLHADHINDFDYQEADASGGNVPHAAHIRKVYPRDADPRGEAFAETKRILRRGIPFGQSFRSDADPDSPTGAAATFPNDRGLVFICYQSSIHDKFEFLQRTWVNNPDFPSRGDGHDPIIAQKDATRAMLVPGLQEEHLKLMQRWVITTGGDYFLSPSLDALNVLLTSQ